MFSFSILRYGHALFMAFALMAFALAIPSAATAQERFFPATEDVEIMLRYLVEDGETPGIVLGLIDADGSTRVISYGDAGPDTRPLGPKSVFEIGSITKTFTGALLADMVARGEMALDDPVQKYLPEGVIMPKWGDRELTLMDLSTHHSGLPRLPDDFDPGDPSNPYADYTVEDLYEFLSGHELRREPGSEYEYSNLAVGLLGHVLELHSGMPYEALVRERILDPLDMDMTGMTLRGELAEWMTKGHNGAGEVVPYWDVITLAGAGGLRSNMEDMLKYVAAQIGPPTSDIERAMRLAHEPRVELDNGAAGGLGWGIRRIGMRRGLTHGGGTAGYSTMIGFDPDLGVGVIRLTNTGDFDDDIALDFLRRGAPLDLGDVAVPTDVLGSYAGLYEPAPGQGVSVRLEDEGWLTIQAPGNVRFRMYAESDSTFYVRRTPWRFTFQKDAEGIVTGVVADLEGSEVRARRVGAETPDPRVVAGNAVARDLPLTAAEMARYEGTYPLDMGARTLEVRVSVEDDKLMAQPSGQGISPLRYQGDHEFVVAAEPGVRLVFTLEDGRAEGLTLHQGGRSISGERQR